MINQKNMNTKNHCGYLEIILGSMYSGKTSRLLEIYNQCKFCDIPVSVINYADDKRYDDVMLSTHDQKMIPCTQTYKLFSLIEEPKIDEKAVEECISNDFDNSDCSKFSDSQELTNVMHADVVLINEGQFFPDLYDFVKFLLKEKKHIYICGLDGDFERKKFGEILDLIPLSDKVEKLTSLCSLCKDGTPGIFSMRLTHGKEQILIGSDNYVPVCRNCYENSYIK